MHSGKRIFPTEQPSRTSRNRDDASILGGERPTGAGTEPTKVSCRREQGRAAKKKNRIDTEILR